MQGEVLHEYFHYLTDMLSKKIIPLSISDKVEVGERIVTIPLYESLEEAAMSFSRSWFFIFRRTGKLKEWSRRFEEKI